MTSINKISISSAVRVTILLIILIANCFFPSGIFAPLAVVCGIIALSISNGRLKKGLVNTIIPLLIVFLIGLSGIGGHESHHILRDIAYALTPVALLATGYWVAEKESMKLTFFKVLLLSGFLIAIVHLFKFIVNPELFTQDIASMRLNAKNPSVDLVTLALVITLFRRKLKLSEIYSGLMPVWLVIPVLIFSFILSFSRTGLVILVLMSGAISGLIGKINLKTFLVFLVFIIFFILLLLTTPRDNVKTFRGKIARSVREMAVREYKDYKSITINWRGHETWLAFKSFREGTTRQKIMGQGFGALVNLEMTMILGGEEFTAVPILHNGYAYILVKTGIIGIFCYIVYYLSLLYRSGTMRMSLAVENLGLSRLLLGTTLSLILTMFVVGGMAEIHDTELVLLTGFVLRKLDQYKHDNSLQC
jgi:hypothetical protein